LLEKFRLSLFLLSCFSCEVLVSSYLINLLRINTGKIDLVGSSDDITSVYSSEWDTVDFEWTGDEENTLGKALEENDTLATETASEEDKNGTRLEG
jgi:hypothetical protein